MWNKLKRGLAILKSNAPQVIEYRNFVVIKIVDFRHYVADLRNAKYAPRITRIVFLDKFPS